MYKVKEEHKNSTVRITKPGKFGNRINLATALQEELKYLFELGLDIIFHKEKKETKSE